MNLFNLSRKNLMNRPLSLILSLLLFALGIGLASLLLQLDRQFQDKFEKNLAGIDLVVGAKGSKLQTILCNLYHVDVPTGNISLKDARPFLNPKHPLVEQSIPLSLGDSYKKYRIVGTLHAYVDLYGGVLAEGRLFEEVMEVTIGSEVAATEGLQIGDRFHSSHGFVQDDELIHDDADQFEVVGILQPSGTVLDQLVLTRTESVWAVHGGHTEADSTADTEGIKQRLLAALPPEVDPMRKALIAANGEDEITSMLMTFRNRSFRTLNLGRNIDENTDMLSASPAYELNRLYANMGIGADSLRVLAWVIIIVSGLSIFISLYNSLKDRRYELALMRVSGASRTYLLLLIIVEGLQVAVLGCLLGLAIGHIGMEILAGFLQDNYRYRFTGWMFEDREWWLIAGALGIGVVAAILPAIQAYQTNISRTLSRK